MRRLVIAIVAILTVIAMPTVMRAQKGQAVFGVQTGYTSTNNSAIAGLFLQYATSDHFRISPEIGCVFRHEYQDAFTLDMNFHFPLMLRQDNMELYPLLGVNYSSWTTHHLWVEDLNDVSVRKSRLGANVGAGYQLLASSTLKLKFEAKYCITKQFSTFVLSVGVGYVF